jgi:hypothetical protein
MCSSIGDFRDWWTCRQNRRERIYIEEEQGIMPEAIKHSCEHVFQHWRIQGLVNLQTEQKREDRH